MAMMACRNVQQVIGVEPDFTPETLPLVDQYMRQLPADSPAEVVELVLATVGCYFGEVVRRLLNGRWAITGDAHDRWRVELINCYFHFRPVGMTGEVYSRGTDERYDGVFSTRDEVWEGLSLALAGATPMPEDEYYSLAGRVDVLELAVDWLTGRELATGEPPRTYTAEDYEQALELEA